MSFNISPIRKKHVGDISTPAPKKGDSKSQKTADKVNQIARMPETKAAGLQGRSVAVLRDAKELSKHIRGDWNLLEPEELAEKIIALEDKVALIKEMSPEVAKIKKQAEQLHFQFVFPIVLELDPSMPHSFVKEVNQVAKRILKEQSIFPFNENLNSVQQREVIRYAGGVK